MVKKKVVLIMDLKIVLGKDTRQNFINEALYLDSLVYQPKYQGTYHSVYERYQKNLDSFILVKDGETIIGYICFFPISQNLYNRILLDNHIMDDDISPVDVLPYTKGCRHHLYIISAVIHPDYRDSEPVVLLTNKFVEFLAKKQKDKYFIDNILASTVSNDGVKLLEKLHFTFCKPLEDSNRLYVCEGNNLKRLTRNESI
jgi:hypothetical protein